MWPNWSEIVLMSCNLVYMVISVFRGFNKMLKMYISITLYMYIFTKAITLVPLWKMLILWRLTSKAMGLRSLVRTSQTTIVYIQVAEAVYFTPLSMKTYKMKTYETRGLRGLDIVMTTFRLYKSPWEEEVFFSEDNFFF